MRNITSLLIANRGEIACRIIRTCRGLGIRTVAVFSTADADALHVELADEKHCIGPPQARASYLDADKIIAAALEHRVDAIHPGYGFLSEKPELAELCERHGLIWVGPSARCIRAMGSKIEAKRLARQADVHGVPGYDGEDQTPRRLLAEATGIGFPVLIKASAGGGGKGMRRVDEAQGFHAALELAKREARAAFGDDRVLLEKYIVRPRHLEVQLAGDQHGNLIHLYERECSIQRNYQKVVEEAPAPRLAPGVRAKLFDAATRLGRAIGYDSLGTVEFLLDADAGDHALPYFLEMNTRLQVEHPVTESITGLDLVALQLRIAAGEALPLSQQDIQVRGHAIEVRLTAEDPAADYRPEIGRIHAYVEPHPGDGVRIDSGVRAGSQVTPHYDSMLAKVIAIAADRSTAARRLLGALDRFTIVGVPTNREFLRDVVRHPTFLAGALSTRFIPEVFPEGFHYQPPDDLCYAAAAIGPLLAKHELAPAPDTNPWKQLAAFRVLARAGHPNRIRTTVSWRSAAPKTVEISVLGRAHLSAQVNGTKLDLRVTPRSGGFDLKCGERLDRVLCHVDEASVHLHLRDRTDTYRVRATADVLAERSDSKPVERPHLTASLTGMIVSVDVQQGQTVSAGQVLVAMEAMKLVHAITAPLAGVVSKIHCAAGQLVTSGARLIEIEPLPAQTAGTDTEAKA